MIRCPNLCSGGLETKKFLGIKRKTTCHVCRGRGFIVETSKFYAKIAECFTGKWELKVEPKGHSKYLVEVLRDE